MTRKEAIELIDNTKNALIDPVAMLNWTWLRVIINNISDEHWEAATDKAVTILCQG